MNLKKQFSKLRLILLIIIFIKGITWSLLTPLWHFPDEQAHFGHIAYLAEGGSLPQGKKPDLTEEIYISEEILGTKRDLQGNNRFTYRPEYRIEYSQTLTGPQEEEIKNLPLRTRKNFVIRESAYYPHFFYRLSGLVYKLFYSGNLFIRVFTLRLFWLAAYLLMIWFVFKLARLIFPKDNLAVLTITILTAMQPMLSFVASGVTSDNLHNLLFTAAIYFTAKILTEDKWMNYLGLAASLAFGLINKPHFLIIFVIIGPVLLLSVFKTPRKVLKYLVVFLIAVAISFLVSPQHVKGIVSNLLRGDMPYLRFKASASQVLPGYSLYQHIIWTVKHTIREALPWYWGVFNWLGVVLPRWVNRLQMRLLVLAAVGLVIRTVKIIKRRKLNHQNRLLLFITWTAVAYFLCLSIWDWTFFRNNGFSFGIQGRYYFPVISAHMILLFVGINSLIRTIGELLGKFFKRNITVCLLPITNYLLSLWFIVLNSIALFTVVNSYYDTTSFKTFIIQASQYKPFFAKGWWLVSILILYLVAAIVLIWQLGRISRDSIRQIKNEK